MSHPIGGGGLGDIVRPNSRVAIVTSDITRPCPTHLMLPEVVEELNRAGVPDGRILVVFGRGIHRGQTPEERRVLVGRPMFDRLRCVDSDPMDVVNVGVTRRGTPVEVFRPVAEADFRICLGNIEPHYFAGYSGGGKAIMPGVCSRASIRSNHGRMLEPGAVAGRVVGNPVREDIDEAASLVGVDFIVNVVLDESKRVVHAVAGDPVSAHREGCRLADSVYKVVLPEAADVVIASAGGRPKDTTLYQAQKALDNASLAVKPGGVVVLVASCAEGLGEDTFERWLREATSTDEVMTRIESDFELGGHKAAALAKAARKARVLLVSELPREVVRRAWMEPHSSVEDAVEDALRTVGPGARIAVMPYAGGTLPQVGD
jgi:nickel-dependent lactate racemase